MSAIQRSQWVDIAKAIAIIAVVIGHIDYNYPNYKLFPITTLFIWLWHVPVFFIIGGFFLKDEKLLKPKSFILGKIKSLYLPILYLYIPITLLHNTLLDIGLYDVSIEYGGKYVDRWDWVELVKRVFEAIFLAGREPALGAVWFAYVLFMALCLISFLSFLIDRFNPRKEYFEEIRCVVLLTIATIGSILTNLFDFTIPRFNNVLTACWLIYIGKLLVRKYNLSFDNKFLFVLSLMIVYIFAIFHGSVQLNQNKFDNIVSLTISSVAALYAIAYISKKCKGRIAHLLSIIGRDSFYIMGLHLIAFKPCVLLLNLCGYKLNLAELLAPAPDIFCFILFVLGGTLLPLGFIYLFRSIKTVITNEWCGNGQTDKSEAS